MFKSRRERKKRERGGDEKWSIINVKCVKSDYCLLKILFIAFSFYNFEQETFPTNIHINNNNGETGDRVIRGSVVNAQTSRSSVRGLDITSPTWKI